MGDMIIKLANKTDRNLLISFGMSILKPNDMIIKLAHKTDRNLLVSLMSMSFSVRLFTLLIFLF